MAARLRRFLWLWWPWAALTVALAARQHWGVATATAVVSTLARLLQPRSEAPRVGLDADMPVATPEFVATMAGATGSPFLAGNSVEVLHNGEAFYRAWRGVAVRVMVSGRRHDNWLTVGTANFDSRSFAHNEESHLTLVDAREAAAFIAHFERDLAACERVALEAWRRRGAVARLQEAVAGVLADQV